MINIRIAAFFVIFIGHYNSMTIRLASSGAPQRFKVWRRGCLTNEPTASLDNDCKAELSGVKRPRAQQREAQAERPGQPADFAAWHEFDGDGIPSVRIDDLADLNANQVMEYSVRLGVALRTRGHLRVHHRRWQLPSFVLSLGQSQGAKMTIALCGENAVRLR